MEAIGLELEDDLFFADLNREISLLIMDDDVNDNYEHQHHIHHAHIYPADPSSLHHYQSSNSYFQQVMAHDHHHHHHNPIVFPHTLLYDNHQHHRNVPLIRDQIRGTGVFIPQQHQSSSPQPTRKINSTDKQQQQSDIANYNIINQNHHPIITSRFNATNSSRNFSINGIY